MDVPYSQNARMTLELLKSDAEVKAEIEERSETIRGRAVEGVIAKEMDKGNPLIPNYNGGSIESPTIA